MGGELPNVLTNIPISTLMDLHEKIGKVQGLVEGVSRAQEDIFNKLDTLQANPYCMSHKRAMQDIDKGHSKIHKLEINRAVNNIKFALVISIFSSAITLITMGLVQKFLL